MDGILLQTRGGLGGGPKVGTSLGTWEWLEAEKEAVARELISEGPLCQPAVSGVQEAEGPEEMWRQIEWNHRGHLEARLREINEAQGRLLNGTFGRCADCGAAIDGRRLKAAPEVALCITCQRSAEPEGVFCTL